MKKIIHTLFLGLIVFSACDGKKYYEGEPSSIIAISDLKKLYNGTDVTLDRNNMKGAYQIRGIVVSDNQHGNIKSGTIAIQGYKRSIVRGITLSIGSEAATFSQGDSIVVDVDGALLKTANGNLQIANVDASKIVKISSGNPVHPVNITAYELDSLKTEYESMLVQVNAAYLTNSQDVNQPYMGDKTISDGSTRAIKIHTEENASFSGKLITGSATYIGIPIVHENAEGNLDTRLWLRSASDILYEAGPVYNGFPESFEGATKTGYANNNVILSTGTWHFTQALLGASSTDRKLFPTSQAVRFQQNLTTDAYARMSFNVTQGASKVTFIYGSFSTDASSSFRLEYSVNSGSTWIPIGETISDASATIKYATYMVNISGNVRFRVNKLGLGTTDNISIFNGRLNIDNFAVYAQ